MLFFFSPETFELGGREEVEDPYMPLRYECTALHVNLKILDFLDSRHVEPQTSKYAQMISQMSMGMEMNNEVIWVVAARIRTGAQLGVVSLDLIDTFPTVCVVKRPNTIVMQQLCDPARTTINCLPTDDHPGAVSFLFIKENDESYKLKYSITLFGTSA